MRQKIRIATRKSKLALYQSNFVAKKLNALGYPTELIPVETEGDKNLLPFEQMSGIGFFTKAVQEALLRGKADIAVHSLKDLPTANHPQLIIGAIPERESPSDLLLVRPEAHRPKLTPLPIKTGGTIGTSSARRRSQITALRPDLSLQPLRGNVPTRIEKLKSGQYDGIILAEAGLNRLKPELSPLIPIRLSPEEFIPTPGQGALAVECKKDQDELLQLLRKIHSPEAAKTTELERKVLSFFRGGCQLPLGAYAKFTNSTVSLHIWYRDKSIKIEADTPREILQLIPIKLSENFSI